MFPKIESFFVKGMQSEINLEGTVMNFVRDPYIEACIKGNLNFDYIGKKVLMDKKITLAGMMMVDARLGCAVNELRKKNYHLIKGAGKLKIQNVVFDHLEKEIHFFIPDVSLDFGYAKNASDFIKQTEVFSGVAEIDTLCLSYKKSYLLICLICVYVPIRQFHCERMRFLQSLLIGTVNCWMPDGIIHQPGPLFRI